jgi:hypothetical protein
MFDIIGTIYKSTGKTLTDNDGNEFPEYAPIQGYHVNTLPEYMSDTLTAYRVTPAAQQRIFAGRDDTVCLRFASEAEFNQVTGYGDEATTSDNLL